MATVNINCIAEAVRSRSVMLANYPAQEMAGQNCAYSFVSRPV